MYVKPPPDHVNTIVRLPMSEMEEYFFNLTRHVIKKAPVVLEGLKGEFLTGITSTNAPLVVSVRDFSFFERFYERGFWGIAISFVEHEIEVKVEDLPQFSFCYESVESRTPMRMKSSPVVLFGDIQSTVGPLIVGAADPSTSSFHALWKVLSAEKGCNILDLTPGNGEFAIFIAGKEDFQGSITFCTSSDAVAKSLLSTISKCDKLMQRYFSNVGNNFQAANSLRFFRGRNLRKISPNRLGRIFSRSNPLPRHEILL